MSAPAASPARPRQAGAGLVDPRLLAWRTLLTLAGADALRSYQQVWQDPELDDAGRTAAAVGVLDPRPRATAGPLPEVGPLAELVAATHLDAGSEAVLATAWWAAVDPQFAVLLGCLHDDAARRHASLGLLAHLLAPLGIAAPLVVDEHHALVTSGLLGPVSGPAAAIELPSTTTRLLAGTPPAPPVPGPLPSRLEPAVDATARLLSAGLRVLVRCTVPEDRAVLREAIAARLQLAPAPIPRSPVVADLLHQLGHELAVALLTLTEPAPPPGTSLAFGAPFDDVPAGWHAVEVPAPGLLEQDALWRSELAAVGLRPTSAEIAELAGRLPLAESTVSAVVQSAASAASAGGRRVSVPDVSRATRAHARLDPTGLAHRYPSAIGLDELVLPAATALGLATLLAHARHSAAAWERMSLQGSRGRGVIALFHGPAGTGKTAAAEAIAGAMDRDLWVVDVARVVSKWLGETQRHLDAVLAAAAAADAVLLFDEADGLFGRRGEVGDARDRYANLEIGHLLTRIERHPGTVVLTTNKPGALDSAFVRRIRLSIRFELPDHSERLRLWARFLPSELLDAGTDPTCVAQEELSGAAIRAAALDASVSALDAGRLVTPADLRTAVRRELDKSRRPAIARRTR